MAREPNPQTSRENPSFFKILMGNFSTQMRIPPAFASKFGSGIPQRIVLWSRGRGSWSVDVKREGSNLYFLKGWNKFVEDNSLEVGDFLLFSYVMNSKFIVKIYGKTGCEKEAGVATRKRCDPKSPIEVQVQIKQEHQEEVVIPPSVHGKTACKNDAGVATRKRCDLNSHNENQEVHIKQGNQEENENPPSVHDEKTRTKRGANEFERKNSESSGDDDVSVISLTKSRVKGSKAFKRNPKVQPSENMAFQVNRKPSCSKVNRAGQRKSKAAVAASKFNSKYPFFKICLSPSYVRSHLCLPMSFYKRYLKNSAPNITLRVSNGSWPVKMMRYPNHPGKLYKGWPAFVKDNHLKIGDVCAFELIKKDDVVFKVSIFRG